jgi:hypothetical protein
VKVASPTILHRAAERDETAAERLDRNTIELLNELRVAGTGIQVMFGFLLVAPSVHHRILFRPGRKRELIKTANKLAIVATAFLALGFTGILVLIADVVTNGIGTALVGVAAAVGIGAIWFALPIVQLRHQAPGPPATDYRKKV